MPREKQSFAFSRISNRSMLPPSPFSGECASSINRIGRRPQYRSSRSRRSICGVISVPSGHRISGNPMAPSRIASKSLDDQT